MALHTDLQTLVRRYGAEVLADADGLRASLDDFLDEGVASPGEINLVVDAVRLGAYERLISMLEHGAEARPALQTAGESLARERGGADVRSAVWACAVLGFAVGRVPADLVVGPPGPDLPGSPDPEPPGDQTVRRQTGAPPEGTGGLQPTWGSGWQSGEPPDGSAPLTSKGSAWLPVGIVAAVVVVVAVAVTGFVLARGNGSPTATVSTSAVTTPTVSADPETGGSGATTPPPTKTPPPDTTVSVPVVRADYAALGSNVTRGANTCQRRSPGTGEADRVTCAFHQLEAEFVTYDSVGALARQRRQVRASLSEPDQRRNADGYYFLASGGGTTTLYWDSTTDQMSAYLEADETILAPQAARTWFDQRGDTPVSRPRTHPREPFRSDDLYEFATSTRYVTDVASDCRRYKPEVSGQVELVKCSGKRGYNLYFARVRNLEKLKDRQDVWRNGAQTTTTWDWSTDSNYPRSGALFKTFADQTGKAVIYWDETELACYGLVFAPDKRLAAAYKYWRDGI